MKKTIIFVSSIVVLTLIFVFLSHKAIQMTGDDKFCASCHVMQPMKEAYITDVHGGNNNLGIKANCVDCHLPHDNIVNYLSTKAYNGIKEFSITAIGADEKIDWYEKLNHKKDYVYDSGCLKCHQDITKINSKNEMQNTMHKRYLDYANELKCVSCHTHVGHDGLRGKLDKK
ncbi:NapC/NirT family cytochrome c [Campylobacter sp. RM12654]|uniref:cytochrome c3 family protein n=1 Tax=unclassified Campylobacter TaxID=2593542 RepID=UPI001DBD6A62|nr:NapC/NirT family cytochrome c [Campylobacter sp. RM12654]MBZ7983125.1 NapC/NirT family cytochrome c [Campylobacter sp. RM12647]